MRAGRTGFAEFAAFADLALPTFEALLALRAFGAACSFGPRRALFTLDTLQSFGTPLALEAFVTGFATRAGFATFARFATLAFTALEASFAAFARFATCAFDALEAGFALDAPFAGFAARTGFA